MRCSTRVLLTGALAMMLAAASHPVLAQTTVKVAYLKTYALLPLYEAQKKGYFKAHGIDLELVTLNNGPAVASAVASGSADIGYAAVLAIAAARSRGEDFKFFAATSYESEKQPATFYVASARSGITGFKDVVGKTVAINAAGAGCELGVLEHARVAGIDAAAIKTISIPFPQMPAALELGNADAACIVEPFFSAVMGSKKIDAHVIATGPIDESGGTRIEVDGFFARGDWLKAHAELATGFAAAFEAGARDLLADPALTKQLLIDELKFPPDVAARVKIYPVASTALDPAAMQPLITAAERRKFISGSLAAADLIFVPAGK